MSHWREGDAVYWHGSSKSRMLQTLEKNPRVCLTVTHFDGLVVARSGFHMSVNYRSAMIFGKAHKVAEPEEKLAKMEKFIERVYPGHWQNLRPVNKQELKAMSVFGLHLDEVVAKVRTGGPIDEPEDYALPIWAGVVPVGMTVGRPASDPRNLAGVTEPRYLRRLKLG